MHVAHGRFLAYGGVTGGGSWVVDAGATLIFGGWQDTLVSPVFSGGGRIRVGNVSVWTNAQVFGTGDLTVGIAGRLGLLGQGTSIDRSQVSNEGLVSMGVGAVAAVHSNFTNIGVLALSAGDLRITGNLTLLPLSVVRVRSTSSTVHGSLSVSGRATLAGTLHSVFTWGAPVGTAVDFLAVGSRAGALTELVKEGLAPDQGIQVQFAGTVGRVVVVSA